MKANEIQTIIQDMREDETSYKCVMISGDWGIGKSYQISATLKNEPSIGYCSLFGKNNVNDVFSQLFVRMTLGKDKPKINFRQGLKDFSWGTFNPLKTILDEILTPELAMDILLSQRDRDNMATLIVLDDIERISNSLDMDQLLGTVEAILQSHKCVRIILVANLLQMKEEQRKAWDKYNEKVVDKVFVIDDLAEEISILDSQERNFYALQFMKKHGSKNLRTLQKADRFFKDISQRISFEDQSLLANKIIEEILLAACYGIVFEETEKIYEKEGQRLLKQDPKDVTEKIWKNTIHMAEYESFEKIVCYKYLDGFANTNEKSRLVQELADSYLYGNGNISIIVAALINMQTNDKPVFYRSDEEVLSYIQEQQERLSKGHYNNLYEFLGIVDSLFTWKAVFGLDVEYLKTLVIEKTPKLYQKSVDTKNGVQWSLNVYYDYVNSNELKVLLRSINEDTKNEYYESRIVALQDQLASRDFEEAFMTLYEIKNYCKAKRFTQKQQFKIFDIICSESLLPLGSISEKQYYCASAAYELGVDIDTLKYNHFLSSAKSKYANDKMFLDRMLRIEQTYAREKKDNT